MVQAFDPVDCTQFSQAIDHMQRFGCVRVRLGEHEAHQLKGLREESGLFFGRDEAEKANYANADFNSGFRAFGRQHSIDQGRPDLNESFVYRDTNRQSIPNWSDISSFTAELHGYWKVMSSLSSGLIAEISRRFDYRETLDLDRDSYIEINWYRSKESRDLLQDRHEDGHLLTMVNADAAGLEIEIDGAMTPFNFEGGDVVVMPGSLLSAMTGNWMRPLYHQVRNHNIPRRSAILFLLNPPLHEPLTPFQTNTYNENLDIAHYGRTAGRMFGLPDAPVNEPQ